MHPLAGSYDYGLVALSIGMAISASYGALDLGGRVTGSRGWVRMSWLVGGVAAMGIGIWSMHFIGLLAFRLPIPVVYHWPTVLVSLLVSLWGSAIAFWAVTRERLNRGQLLTGSVFMGLALALMHYIGMAAMRLSAVCQYSVALVFLSLLIGVFASFAAIVFTFDYRENFRGTTLAKMLSAAVIGGAISLMHYTGMLSANFFACNLIPNLSRAVSISSLGLGGIAVGTLLVQRAVIVTSLVDRRFAHLARELQSSEGFREIADALRDVLVLSKPDFGEILFVNRAYEVIWGRPLESLYARPRSWLEGVHPEDRGRVQEQLRLLTEGHSSESLEYRVVRPDGSISWVRSRTLPIFDQHGHSCRVLVIVHEFTKRKEAEEALRSSEREQRRIAAQLERERARLVEAQEVAKIGSWEAELPNLDVTWSEQTYRIFETDPSRFHPTRTKFLEFVHPEDRAKVDAAFAESLDKSAPCRVEYRIVLPDGRGKILEERWRAFHDEEGGPVRIAGTCRDITEYVLADEEVQRLSGELLRLQDEERRKIARDLHDSTGQDLVALATSLGLLLESVPPSMKKPRALAAQCQEVAERCIREVRTLSYLLHPPMLDELGLGDAIRHFVSGFTKRSGIEVGLEINPNFGRMREDVELALFRIVQESLVNIQRHSGSPRAKILLGRDAEGTVVEVSDTGHGTSGRNLRSSVEEPFEIGVGISSMKERVKLIGGHLDIISGNSGTTVRVTISGFVEGDRNTAQAAS